MGDSGRFKTSKFSFSTPFQFVAGSAVPHFEYGGNALVMDEFVRLTPDRQSRAGWIYNVDQCYIHNWRATAQIRMHGAGGRVFGDGMAIWYRAMAPRKMSTGEVFGAPDRFSGLGVFLDTFDNNADRNNPIISVMVGDGATAYDNMDGMKTAVAHCSAEIRGTPEPVVIEIQYLNAVLTVRYTLGTSTHAPRSGFPASRSRTSTSRSDTTLASPPQPETLQTTTTCTRSTS